MSSWVDPMESAIIPASYVSPLATQDQAETERLVMRIMADPGVRTARAAVRERMALHATAALPDGAARLDHALDAWLAYLAVQEATGDTARPKLVWNTNLTRYRWFGHEFPGSGAAIDNPDVVYRHCSIDGVSDYEITGQLRPMHPGNFSFQLVPFEPGLAFKPSKQNANDLETMGVVGTPDIAIAADGSFMITIGPGAADGRPNHLQTPPELLRLIIRDVLTDWKQNPNLLSIRRVAGPDAPPAATEADLARSTAEHLDGFVGQWLTMIDHYLGPPPLNTLGPVWGRVGGWGMNTAIRFRLEEDEALLFTVTDGHAEYAGIQVTDPWLIAPDAQHFLASYTSRQARPNADGSFTYVVAPRDPGAANWIETDGVREGWLLHRWQSLPRDRKDGDGLVKDFAVAKVRELGDRIEAGQRGVTPAERERQRAIRTAEWRLRVAGA